MEYNSSFPKRLLSEIILIVPFFSCSIQFIKILTNERNKKHALNAVKMYFSSFFNKTNLVWQAKQTVFPLHRDQAVKAHFRAGPGYGLYHISCAICSGSNDNTVLYYGTVAAANAPRCTAAEGLLYKPWSLVFPTCTARCLHQRP